MKVNLIALQKILSAKSICPTDLTKCGISSTTIAKIMRGNEVRPGTILKIANILNVPMERLVEVDPFYDFLKENYETAVLRS